jgi:putative mycofactocin binding protein MftB
LLDQRLTQLINEFCCHLFPGVRVRKEKFGLLFYNTKDTNLTFVKSGNLLKIENSGNSSILTINPDIAIEESKFTRLIKLLKNKRLILEA